LICHAEDRLARVPAGHEGWTNDVCLLCHVPG
jgi:hypothetical protein